MGGEAESIGADVSWAEARSALAWWLDAGVDLAVQEQPRNWLKPKPQAGTVAGQGLSRSQEPPNIAQPTQETLAELQDWLGSSLQLPLANPRSKRVLPHGPEQSKIMLLSDSPALEDAAAGQPIGGDAWALAVRMLAAIGIGADEAYSASLSCLHTPGARMSQSDRDACAEITRRHIALAKPARLLLFGDGPSVALLGKRLVEARGHIHKVEGVRTIATFHPRHLINRPLDKSLAWKDLLLLMENES